MAGRAVGPKGLVCAVAGAGLALSPALVPGLVPALVPAPAVADDGGGASAQQLAQEAKKNLLDAKSVRLKLTDHSAGTAASRTQPVFMDLALDQHGNCAGIMRMAAKGGSVELIKRGEQVWMKPDTAFWKAQVPGSQGAAVAELFKNRYIHGSTKDALLKGLADTCDLSAFQKQVDTGSSAHDRTLTKGAETTIDGTKVVPLKGTEAGRRSVLYVTSKAPHRLVRAAQRGGGTDMTLDFTDYGKPVPSKTPPASQSVDIGKLQQELQNT
ncbi:hypothetical protein ABZT17_02130 [Streptomyces sp. NPDC005648]|uniref:hypothetical protein n=1 Tax=Streptomyces sp. NPDC005648 TaxID=3157044 RepID=UPI0033A47BDF